MFLQVGKHKHLFILFGVYLAARIITYNLEIYPVGNELALKMQLINPLLLKEDFFKSLYYLHYQPPVWNFIYGIMIKIFGINYSTLSTALHFFNIFLSFVMIYYFYLIANYFKLKKKEMYIFYLIFFVFSLSFLFYETYIHYTHLTALLFAQISYLFLRFDEKYSLKFEIYIYLTALLLSFTWSAFSHPLFIFVIFIGICLIKFKKNILRSFLLLVIFSLLTLTLSIKNKIEFNIFASSSWIGMQIFTVLSFDDNWGRWDECNFSAAHIIKDELSYKKNNINFNNNHPSVVGALSKYNNVGFIYRTKKCLKLGINQIINDPLRYIKRVKYLIISNHGHYAFDHIGWDPKEWRKYFNFFYDINNNKFFNPIKVRSLQLYHFIMYLFFTVIVLRSIFFINNDKDRYYKPIASIFLVYLWLMIVTHMAAGYEHERFRFTGHFLNILFIILLLKNRFINKSLLKIRSILLS